MVSSRQQAPTRAPVVLPKFTASPRPLETEVYDPEAFGDEQFPIISLITAESDVPEAEKYVSFTFGSGNTNKAKNTNIPVHYENTADDTRELVVTAPPATVFTRSTTTQNTIAGNSDGKKDELYYIYYQDPDQDPAYGVRLDSEHRSGRSDFGHQPSKRASSVLPDTQKEDKEVEEADTPHTSRLEPTYRTRANRPGQSRVSFNFNVGGKTSGFSYNL